MQVFQFEHFYLALTNADTSTPGVQVLARTSGIRPEHVVECRRLASLLPPPPNDTTPSALGLFRGETIDYILVKAQQGPGNVGLLHYLLVPSANMRFLEGNLRTFEPFAAVPIPIQQQAELPLFNLGNPAPPTESMQIDDMNALLGYAKNVTKMVGNLLAVIVQGMGLAIVNAPDSIRDRLTFLQGLLSLLPPPARVAITFATYVSDPAQTNTQIKFLATDEPVERHLIFDWATGKLHNDPPEQDTYTKFILAQLRLDLSLVVKETEKLGRTAVWRAMRRENMASALAWASRRASLDRAVEEGQPADRSMVAAVLREDPTLPDELRVAYSRHLLALALALEDPEHTDIIPALAAQNKEISDAIYNQLWAAAGSDKAQAVQNIVEYWIAKAPMGVDVNRWRPLLGMASTARVNALLGVEPAQLVSFLERFITATPDLHMEPNIAHIVNLCRKRGHESPEVARAVFLLAAIYLPLAGLQKLVTDLQFLNQLPAPLRASFAFLLPDGPKPAPVALLTRASEVFGPEHAFVILGRLCEWALTVQRLDLIEAGTLSSMVKMAASPYGDRFDTLIHHIVEDLSQLNILKNMEPDIQKYLVQLSLARKRYDDAVTQLLLYQDMLYQSARHDDMSEVARTVFREVPLETLPLLAALEAVHRSQLKPSVTANIDLGALEAKNWSVELEPAARHLTGLLYADPRLISILKLEPTMQLLQANADRHDAVESLRLAGAIVSYALTFDLPDPTLIIQVYSLLTWNPTVAEEALEVVRNYVRRAPKERAAAIPAMLGARFGEAIRLNLESTYRMRRIVGGTDLADFADRVINTAQLLFDVSTFYNDSKDLPQTFKLRRNIESMPGGLSEPERNRLAQNLNMIAEQIFRLHQWHQNRLGKRNRAEQDARRTELIKNRTSPVSALEALVWVAGHLSDGAAPPPNLNREAPNYLLGTRSINILLRETDQTVRLLIGLQDAFPERQAIEVGRRAWVEELDTLWAMLTLYKQREIHAPLIENLQLLAHEITTIGERASEKSLQSTGYGRQLYTGRAQPRSVIEVLRWLSGYFAHEHVATKE